MRRVVVTGVGIITSIGTGAGQVFRSLRTGKHGIGLANYLPTAHRDIFPLGEVKLSNEDLMSSLGLEGEEGFTRTSLLAIMAASEAVRKAGWNSALSARTALISATTVGGMCKSEQVYHHYLNDNTQNAYINTHDCGDSTEKVAEYIGHTGYLTTINTACSSSANAIMLGTRMIRAGLIDYAIVGGTDALSKFTLNGFNSLMILDKQHCRPFDESRTGLNLGEGAAFLVIEAEEVSKDKAILGEIRGFANANDAFHQTASSEEGTGAFMAMEQALKVAGLNPSDISYINVHGTGTGNNDLSEGRALKRLFGENIPPFSSTKAFTGHTLGACGAIEAVIALLSIQQSFLPANLNFNQPIAELGLVPVQKGRENISVAHVLSNSFGFGGNNTSLVISKY